MARVSKRPRNIRKTDEGKTTRYIESKTVKKIRLGPDGSFEYTLDGVEWKKV